jgi:predicted DsbA family dithiol-disulfide isomerase
VETLDIDIWSDIACPWCYVGKRRLETALGQFEARDRVRLTWHAFELDPAAPARVDKSISYPARLARKYRTTEAKAKLMIVRMTEMAEADGLRFDFDNIQPGNTFDAHRLLHLALHRGKQDELKERLLRGYLCEGQAIGDRETLVRLASEPGLDPEEVTDVLASDTYREQVRADEANAYRIGVSGVPFFVIGRYAISGAQPSEAFLRILERVRTEMPNRAEPLDRDGSACSSDGCDG